MKYKEISHKEYSAIKFRMGPFKVIYPGGTTEWRLDGVLHRISGPAIQSSDGYEEWCKYGELHREDGPALNYFDNSKGWGLDGVIYSKEEWFSKLTPEQLAIALANPENF